MAQLIEFKASFIRICPVNPAHLLRSQDRGKSWQIIYDGTICMNCIMDIASNNEIMLLDSYQGFFISKSGVYWTKINELKQLEDLNSN